MTEKEYFRQKVFSRFEVDTAILLRIQVSSGMCSTKYRDMFNFKGSAA